MLPLPAQTQLTQTAGYETPTESELVGRGFQKEIIDHTSTVTGITYRFPRYIDATRTAYYAPLILQNPDRTFSRKWIRANAAFGLADADRFLAAPETKDLHLVKYPDPLHVAATKNIPGLQRLIDDGYFLIAPRWCTTALFAMEAYPGVGNTNQFTTVISDSIPFPHLNNLVFTREQDVVVGVNGLQDPAVVEKLKMTGISRNVVDGQTVEKKEEIPGAALIANQGFMQSYLKVAKIDPTPTVSNVMIGRPECVDLVSEFIVVKDTAVSQPIVQPFQQPATTAPPTTIPIPDRPIGVPTGAGFQPAPGFAPIPTPSVPTAFHTPEGFAPIVSTPAYAGQGPRATLDSSVNGRLRDFLLKSRCRKSKVHHLSRVDTLVQRIIDKQRVDYAGIQGKYFNLSTCQPGAAKGLPKGTPGLIPGTNLPLNLTIAHDDLRAILIGEGKDKLEGPKWDPLIEEVFRKAAEIIFERLGSTTRFAEESLTTVPLSVLDTIPSGPSPAGRGVVMAKTPFINTVPLSGVIEVTVPIHDGTRCLPGLMAKKRD